MSTLPVDLTGRELHVGDFLFMQKGEGTFGLIMKIEFNDVSTWDIHYARSFLRYDYRTAKYTRLVCKHRISFATTYNRIEAVILDSIQDENITQPLLDFVANYKWKT